MKIYGRKITQDAVAAFLAGKAFSRSNTQVEVEEGAVNLRLHGNLIARRLLNNSDEVIVTLSGWNTTTTRERLRGLLQAYNATVYQHNWYPYIAPKGDVGTLMRDGKSDGYRVNRANGEIRHTFTSFGGAS